MTAHLIVLAGLPSMEKALLAAELGAFWAQQGLAVTILDNIARLAIDPETVCGAQVMRVAGEALPHLAHLLAQTRADTVIFAVSETVPIDALFATLSALDGVRVTVAALIDTRTCDCFPHLRAQLEADADVVIRLPYDLRAAVAALD